MNALHFQKYDISKFKVRCDTCREFSVDPNLAGKGCSGTGCPGIFQAIKVYQVALDAADIEAMKADGVYHEYKTPESEKAIQDAIADGVIKQETLDAIGSTPDPSTQAKGACSVCRRQCYDEKLIGARCTYVDSKTGHKCLGMFEGMRSKDDATRVCLDGDKVVQICKAMERLAKDFEALNIFEIKEAFLAGRKVMGVEDLIRVSKIWDESFAAMRKRAGEAITEFEVNKARSKETLAYFDEFKAKIPVLKQHSHAMMEFLSLCDRLDVHRKSGLLEALSTILKPNNSSTQ